MGERLKICLQKKLRHLIERNHLSQHQLASALNINRSTLHNYLNGVQPQGLVTLIKISRYFDISLDELVFDQEGSSKKNLIYENFEEGTYEVIIKKIKLPPSNPR
ncbi:MAG: helix-turn-helix transcriptional regulator [Pseudomonadota bacterium]